MLFFINNFPIYKLTNYIPFNTFNQVRFCIKFIQLLLPISFDNYYKLRLCYKSCRRRDYCNTR